jgi:hypothetical protein
MATLVAYETSGKITHVFRGEDLDALHASASVNGCTRWIVVGDEFFDPKVTRVSGGALVPAVEDQEVNTQHRRESMRVSRRQMILALARAGIISEPEAIAAAATGALPAALESALATLPASAAFEARVTWASMTEVERLHPLVDMLASSRGMQPTEVDQLFDLAATF